MRPYKIALAAVLFASSIFASVPTNAQAVPTRQYGLTPGQTSLLDLGVNYAFFHANAPPSACGCFSLEGGSATIVLNMPTVLSWVGDISVGHANNINATPQNITILNVLVGPRFSFRTSHRVTPYFQALVGASRETSNYAAVHDVSAFAFSPGLGLNARLTRHLQWNLVEADYLYSQLPNAVNNYQNDLRITTGLAIRLGPR